MTSPVLNLEIPYKMQIRRKCYFSFIVWMSLTKLCKPSETALRQLFNRQLFWICVLSSNGKMAPNSAVSHDFIHHTKTQENKVRVTKGLFAWSRNSSLPRGNSLTPGSNLPRCTVWRLWLFTWVFRWPGATSRGGLPVVQHRVARFVEVTFLHVNRTQKLSRGKISLAHVHY